MSNTDMKFPVPVVDFQALSINRNLPSGPEDDNEIKNACKDVCDAFMNVGFVYLKNTGITDEQVDELKVQANKFFLLDPEIKAKYPREPEYGTGYFETKWVEGKGDLKQVFHVHPSQMKAWPDEHVPSFKTVTSDFYKSCTKLADRLLFAISTGLHLPDRSYLNNCHQINKGKNGTILRLLRYPPVPADIELKPGQVRMEEHTDFTTITLLFQDQAGGLEVQCRDGVYRPATPIDGTVLVNIGDLLQRWTADKLVSNKHRVLVPEEETKRQKPRFSVVFFVSPEPDVLVQCLDGSDKYEPILTLDYQRERYTYFGYQVSKK